MKKRINDILLKISEHLSACMVPLVPVIIAGSLMKLVGLILDMTGLLTGSTMNLLEIIGDAPFYFLPVMVAVTAAEHFGANRFYTLGAACMMMMPDFTALMESEKAVTFAMIPVIKANYAYNILPVILLAWLLAEFEPKAAKKFPEVLRGTIYPLLVFTVTCVCGFLVVGPIGTVISSVLSALLNFLSAHAGILAWPLFAAIVPVLIPMGMHWIFVTMAITNISVYGYDEGLMAGFFIANMALAGASLAVSLRTKDSELRGQALSAGIVALLSGVTEPALFGVCLKEKKALRGAMIAGALSGVYVGLVNIRCYIYSFPAVCSILMFKGPDGVGNLINAVILCALAVVSSFLVTFFSVGKKA